jgi:hypothetical protein
MPKLITITPEKIKQVKKGLSTQGIRETARQTGVSFYTAWCIKEGKYDQDGPLQRKVQLFDLCPITGFK